MTPLTAEWVEKAEGDRATALRELRASHSPNYDAVCFHTQQCAEKYLKARLQEANIGIEKTHNLPRLLDQLLPVEPTWDTLRPYLLALTVYAINFRYPGDAADKEEAREAVRLCRRVRLRIRRDMGLAR
jgi:HEPN domain-containing protein